MRVEFDLRDLRERARHPWVVRSGTCEETVSRDLSSRAVQLLEARVDLTAQLKTTIRVRLTPGFSYHVAIAASTTAPDTFIACGPLVSVP